MLNLRHSEILVLTCFGVVRGVMHEAKERQVVLRIV